MAWREITSANTYTGDAHTYTHKHEHTHKHTHFYTHTLTHTHTHTHHTHINTHTHKHTHTHTNTRVRTHIYPHIHTCDLRAQSTQTHGLFFYFLCHILVPCFNLWSYLRTRLTSPHQGFSLVISWSSRECI